MTRLGTLVELNPRAGSAAEPVSLIGLADIDAREGTVTPRPPTREESARPSRRACEGDVLFARISPSMENGKVAIVPPMETAAAAVSSELLVLRPLPGVDPRFVWAFLRQRRLLEQLAKLTTGSAGYRRLDPRLLMEVVVPRDQEAGWDRDLRIIEHLDEAISLRRQVLERARLLAGAAAAVAAEEKATALEPLGSRVELRYGTPEGSEETGEVPALLVPNLRDGSIAINRIRYVRDRDDLPRLRQGDLLLARVGGTPSRITQAAVYEGNPPGATFGSPLLRIRAVAIDPHFLWVWLQTEEARRFCLERSSTLRDTYRLSLATLRALPVPVLSQAREAELARFGGILRGLLATSNRQLELLGAAVQAHLEQVFPGSVAVPPEGVLGFESTSAASERHPPESVAELAPIFAVASDEQRERWRQAVSMGSGFRTAELIVSEQARASVQHTLAVLDQLGVVVREREGVIDHWRQPDREDEMDA